MWEREKKYRSGRMCYIRAHDARRARGEMEKSSRRRHTLTIYASFSPSLRFPRSSRGKKRGTPPDSIEGQGGMGRKGERGGVEEEEAGKKFLGISNTPEVFIAEAGHVSGARRQKFEITCSDVHIPEHTCLSLPPNFSLSLSLLSVHLSIYLFHPSSLLFPHRFTLSLSRGRDTLSASRPLERPRIERGWYLSAYGCTRGERKHAVAGLHRAEFATYGRRWREQGRREG